MIKLNIIETKNSNMPTIEASFNEKKTYLYSKYNPNRDSIAFAEDVYEKGIDNYLIYGFGLGYHINSLVDLIDDNAHIYVFECNKDIFNIARENVNLEKIFNNKNITVEVLENGDRFFSRLKDVLAIENIKLGIHNPSLQIIPNEFIELKHLLEEFLMKQRSIEASTNILDANFEENIKNYDENVDILFNKFKDKPLYIIAAGPSLDKNIHELSKVKEKGIILSVGRAARPLPNANITPDYIILTDPSPHLYNSQLKGLKDDVPLIVLSTADKNIMKKYNGKKYIAFQNGHELAENYAKENNNKTVNTGGSVATTALDVAIKMGANPIIFVGQDLGFTDNMTHSSKARSRNIVESHSLRNIEGVHGGIIQTSKNLSIYLRWIQNRIKEEKNIEFIDATEGGAKIMGTKIKSLKDVVESY